MPTPGTESGWSLETLHNWGGSGAPYVPGNQNHLAVDDAETTLYVGDSFGVTPIDLSTFTVGTTAGGIGNARLVIGDDGYLYATITDRITRSSPDLVSVVADTSWLDQTAFTSYTLEDICRGRDGHLYVTGYLTSGGQAVGPWRVWRIDPGSPPAPPSTTPDSSGHGRDGTLTGTSITFPSSPWSGFGNAFQFPSSAADGVQCPGVPHVDGTDWTLEAKVETNVGGTTGGGSVCGWYNGTDQGPQLWINGGGTPDAGVFWHDAGGFQFIGGAITLGTTIDLTASYDGVTVRVFIDGVLVASQASTGQDAYVSDFWIGNDDAGENLDHVIIDEVRVSNTARYTAGYTPAAAPFSADGTTLALYHLDSHTGSYPPAGATPATGVHIAGLDEATDAYRGIAVTSDGTIWLGLMAPATRISGWDVFAMNRVRQYTGAITDIDVQDPLAVADADLANPYFTGENVAGIYADANDNVLIPLISQWGSYPIGSPIAFVPYSWFLHLHPGGSADLIGGQWDVQFLDDDVLGSGGASSGADVGSQMFALLYEPEVIPTETSGTGWTLVTSGTDVGWYAPGIVEANTDGSVAGTGITNLSIPWSGGGEAYAAGQALIVSAISATAIGTPFGWTAIDNSALGGHFSATWTRVSDGSLTDNGPFPMGGDVWQASYVRLANGSVIAHSSIDNTTALDCTAAAVSHDSAPETIIGVFLGESGSVGNFGAPTGWAVATQINADGVSFQPQTIAREYLTAADSEPFGPETAVAAGLVSGARRGIAITVKGTTGWSLYRRIFAALGDGAVGGSSTFVPVIRGKGLTPAGPLYLSATGSGTSSPIVFPGLHSGHPGFSLTATGVLGWHVFGYDMASPVDGVWLLIANPGVTITGTPPSGVAIQADGPFPLIDNTPTFLVAWTQSYPDLGGNVADGLLGSSLAANVSTGGLAMAASNLYFLDGPLAGTNAENLVRRLVGPSAGLGFALGHHMSFT